MIITHFSAFFEDRFRGKSCCVTHDSLSLFLSLCLAIAFFPPSRRKKSRRKRRWTSRRAPGASTLESWRSSPTSPELRLPMLSGASNAWVSVLLFVGSAVKSQRIHVGTPPSPSPPSLALSPCVTFSPLCLWSAFVSSHGREGLREVAGPLHGHHEAKHSQLRGAAQEPVWK